MAARKPTSVFVIVENQGTRQQHDTEPTSLTTWRVALEKDETLEQAVERCYAAHPAGSVIAAVLDTQVTGFTVGVKLDPVDDIRLDPVDGPVGLDAKGK